MQKRQLLQLQSLWLQRRLLVKMPPRLQLALPCRKQKEQINSDGQPRGGPHSHPYWQQLGGRPAAAATAASIAPPKPTPPTPMPNPETLCYRKAWETVSSSVMKLLVMVQKASGPKLSDTCSCSAFTDALAEDREHIWQAINALRMHIGMAGNTLS